jgi:hypothetical protein
MLITQLMHILCNIGFINISECSLLSLFITSLWVELRWGSFAEVCGKMLVIPRPKYLIQSLAWLRARSRGPTPNILPCPSVDTDRNVTPVEIGNRNSAGRVLATVGASTVTVSVFQEQTLHPDNHYTASRMIYLCYFEFALFQQRHLHLLSPAVDMLLFILLKYDLPSKTFTK